MSRREEILREDGLRADIERTRAELADTVDLLVEKADVRGRASAKADELRGRVALAGRQAAEWVRRDPVPVAVGAALGLGAVGALARGLRH
ncbi:DUF3618 domain-containing protein [Actinokineospora sp. NPDC004072]